MYRIKDTLVRVGNRAELKYVVQKKGFFKWNDISDQHKSREDAEEFLSGYSKRKIMCIYIEYGLDK